MKPSPNMTLAQRIAFQRALERQLPCPACGAGRNEGCKTSSGIPLRPHHAARRKAVPRD